MGQEIAKDPTTLTFDEYATLSIEQRIEWADKVEEHYADEIRRELGSKTWILACGPGFQVVASAASFSEVMVDDEVWDRGKELGYAPFQVFAEETIDDQAVA